MQLGRGRIVTTEFSGKKERKRASSTNNPKCIPFPIQLFFTELDRIMISGSSRMRVLHFLCLHLAVSSGLSPSCVHLRTWTLLIASVVTHRLFSLRTLLTWERLYSVPYCIFLLLQGWQSTNFLEHSQCCVVGALTVSGDPLPSLCKESPGDLQKLWTAGAFLKDTVLKMTFR